MRTVTLAFIFCLLFAFYSSSAQTPNGFNYQAVARDASNQLLSNKTIGCRISILNNSATGSAVYVETQSVSTNAVGLYGFTIGGGTVQSGNISTIDWGNGTKFLKVETDLNGGSNYTLTSTTQFLSVPYAFYSKLAHEADTAAYVRYGQTVSTNELAYMQVASSNATLFTRKLYNNPYTIPAGKTLLIRELSYYFDNQQNNRVWLKVDADTVVEYKAFVVPSGKTVSSSDTSVSLVGYLFDANLLQGVYQNITSQSYTVPVGKTFYMTYFEKRRIFNIMDFVWDPVYYLNGVRMYGYGLADSEYPFILPSGTVISGFGRIGGYLK